MKNYVSPVIFDNEELAEGVYATGSGAAGCWTVTGKNFHQAQSIATNAYTFQLDMVHHGDHASKQQDIHLYFSANVTLDQSRTSTVTYVSGDGTNEIVVRRINHANGSDNVGMGDVYIFCNDPTVSFTRGSVDCTHE